MADEPTASETAAEGPSEPDVKPASGPVVRFLAMIVAGLIAAGLANAVIHGIGDVYVIAAEHLDLGAQPSAEQQAAADAAQLEVDSGNAMIWMAATGAVFASVFALMMGLLRRAGARATMVGVVAGILLGGALGCLAGYQAVSLHDTLSANLRGARVADVEHKFMMMHGATWGLIGLAVGLACGMSGRPRRAGAILQTVIVAGVMGGLAGVAFPLVAGVACPLVKSSLPIPEPGQGRILWMGLSSIMMGIGLGRTG